MSNGIFSGDLALGDYFSLRNEAFISHENIDILPSDRPWWNAKNHHLHFWIKDFKLKKTFNFFL